MSPIGTAFRRTLLFVVVAVGIGAALSWRRTQTTTPAPTEPPQWPDWPARTDIADPPQQPRPTERNVPEQTWLPANDDGSVPDGHPIKAKESSGIFHAPGGRFYERTKPDRCYPTAEAAEADGYRRSKT